MNTISIRILAVVLLLLTMVSTISAAEIPPFYIISAEAGHGGYIVPSGDWPVNPGSDQIFYFIPDDSYEVKSVIVNSIDLGARRNYVFYNVDRNQTISVTFTKQTGSFSIASSPPGASIYIDGGDTGVKTSADGPLTVTNTAIGERLIELKLEGYSSWSQKVLIKTGQTTVISLVTLSPILPPTTIPTTAPTTVPTTIPTTIPTTAPTTVVTTIPTTKPTTTPTTVPTTVPTTAATTMPTTIPTTAPTTSLTTIPTTTLTTVSTTIPTTAPTTAPVTSITSVVTTITTKPTTLPVTSPTATRTTNQLPYLTTPVTTPSEITIIPATSPTADTNTSGPVFPPWSGGANGIPALMLMGGLCVGLVMVDLFSRSVPESSLPSGKRAMLFILYLAVVAGLIGALALFSTILNPAEESTPYISLLIPLSGYLLVSGLALLAGTLLTHPLRWTLGGHILFSLIGAFTAALALIGSPSALRLPLLLTFGCSLIGGIAARWEYISFVFTDKATAGVGTGDGSGITIVESRTSTVPSSFPAELLDKFQNPELIGVGGIARVFRADNVVSGKDIALKIPVQFNETAGKCFIKEITAWEDLHHENIVKIFEVNILPVPFVEMEYINQSLADLKKPMSPENAATMVRGIASGLAYAHEKGIVHRDIKPQNILVTPEGVPKITDWGMSKVIGACMLPTITGFSLSYAAPEQIAPEQFGETDQRTDIYQAGVVFFELLTGALPFAGEDISLVSRKIIADSAPAPSEKNPAAHSLDEIVQRCLEKDKDKRYQSAEELIADIDRYFSHKIETDRYEVFED